MPIKHLEEYRDAGISQKILAGIKAISKRPVRLMEVCGTHTMSIFRSGIRSMLPENISLLSGPGCPVCVTSQQEIDTFIELAKLDDCVVTTFGDLMRIPGTISSLQKENAEGADIHIVYSAFDAVKIARDNPDKRVVFLGVGFETTAPTIAASIMTAVQEGIENFSVFSAHKLVPPALDALMTSHDARVDGFILPGHVSVIIGTKAYKSFFDKHQIPCVIAGFEPVDILNAIYCLVEQIERNKPMLENEYQRAVTFEGNIKGRDLMAEIFEHKDTFWRGLGRIKISGLCIKDDFRKHDAEKIFDINVPESEGIRGCICGEILTGIKTPPNCPLYKKSCTPIDPIGPCMVSSEGTCAAYFRYGN